MGCVGKLKSNLFTSLCLFFAICVSGQPSVLAADGNRATSCDGCSYKEARREAMRMTDQGEVYVFDFINASVSAFNVVSKEEDSNPDTLIVKVTSLEPDEELQEAYERYVSSMKAFIDPDDHDSHVED